MKNLPGKPHELEVSRADLIAQLKFAAKAMDKSSTNVTLRFQDGMLVIEAGESTVEVFARGNWPAPIISDVLWVRVLAKKMPAGDPIRLRVQDGKLYTNAFAVRCAFSLEELPPILEPPKTDERRLIVEAAEILKPLRLSKDDVEKLVTEARARGNATWTHHDKKMIEVVARAWKLLAPLGVETSDIRRCVDDAVRNAWKRSESRDEKEAD
jgi:hypothetical protein